MDSKDLKYNEVYFPDSFFCKHPLNVSSISSYILQFTLNSHSSGVCAKSCTSCYNVLPIQKYEKNLLIMSVSLLFHNTGPISWHTFCHHCIIEPLALCCLTWPIFLCFLEYIFLFFPSLFNVFNYKTS